MERVGGVFDGRDRPHRRRRRSRRARGERNGTRVRVCATLMFAPAGIGAVIAGSHALLLRCLATGHARGVVGTLALLRGHATQGVKDGVVGEGARTRFADASGIGWKLQLAVRAIGARLDAINTRPAGVGAKISVGDNAAGQNEEAQEGYTH